MMTTNGTMMEPRKDFVTIDLEYADSAQNICQIGLAVVRDLQIKETHSWFVCPPDNHYEERFVEVHHITPLMTMFSPSFKEVWPEIEPYLRGQQLWAHNALSVEGPVLEKNLRRHGIEDGPYRIYDSRDLYQRPGCGPNRGNGLEQCCLSLGMPCENHHNADADAWMCARIIIAYKEGIQPVWDNVPVSGEELRKTQQEKRTLHLGEFREYYNETSSGEEDVLCEISSTYQDSPMQTVDVFDKGDVMPGENEGRVEPARLDTGTDNPLYGKRVVLTGVFQIRRDDIKAAIKEMGGRPTGSISSKTDAIIIGTKNVSFRKLIDLEQQEAAGHHLARIVGDLDLNDLLYGEGRKFFR